MKIIREGDPRRQLRPIVFLCLHCGCEFEATKDEYSEDQIEGQYCKCPCCGEYASHVLGR